MKNAIGSAPLPPIAADDLTALGWTNDSILYGSRVNLWVESEDAAIEEILSQLPSCSSDDFGVPFLDIFNRYDRDFYKIDKMLFSPAKVVIHNIKTGQHFPAASFVLTFYVSLLEFRMLATNLSCSNKISTNFAGRDISCARRNSWVEPCQEMELEQIPACGGIHSCGDRTQMP